MISVIVPAYNIAPYLERCINSILNQTYTDYEILLIDDGSTDGTSDICDKLAMQDKRVRVFHKKNGGVSSARNVGLKNIKGDYISIIDGDDWIENNLFADAMEFMHKYKTEVFMYEYFIENKGRTNLHMVDSKCYGVISTEDALINTITPNNRFVWTKIYKADLSKLLQFNEKIILGEDTLFISSVIANAVNIYYSDTAYYHYDQRENSAVRSAFRSEKLSGLLAYKLQLQMCEEKGFKKAAEYARGALLELAVSLSKRVSESGKNKKEALKVIKSYIRQETGKAIFSKYVSKKIKVKAITACISINLASFLCRMLSK